MRSCGLPTQRIFPDATSPPHLTNAVSEAKRRPDWVQAHSCPGSIGARTSHGYRPDVPGWAGPSPTDSVDVIESMIAATTSHLAAATGYPRL